MAFPDPNGSVVEALSTPAGVAAYLGLPVPDVTALVRETHELGFPETRFGGLVAPSLLAAVHAGVPPKVALQFLRDADLDLLAQRLSAWEWLAEPGVPLHTPVELVREVRGAYALLGRRITLPTLRRRLAARGIAFRWPHSAALLTYPMGADTATDDFGIPSPIGAGLPQFAREELLRSRSAVHELKFTLVRHLARSIGRIPAQSFSDRLANIVTNSGSLRGSLADLLTAERLLAQEWVRAGLRTFPTDADAGGLLGLTEVAAFHDEENTCGYFRRVRSSIPARPEGSAYAALVGSESRRWILALDVVIAHRGEFLKRIGEIRTKTIAALAVAAGVATIVRAAPGSISEWDADLLRPAIVLAEEARKANRDRANAPSSRPVTAAGLLRILRLLQSRLGEFVSARDIAKAHGNLTEDQVPAEVRKLRRDHGYAIESAPERARKGDSVAQEAKGYVLIG